MPLVSYTIQPHNLNKFFIKEKKFSFSCQFCGNFLLCTYYIYIFYLLTYFGYFDLEVLLVLNQELTCN